jgi:hypothetical protein
MSEKLYVFDYYLFASRRGHLQWIWEIRRKSKPDQRYFSADGFRSAKAAEEAGKIVLADSGKGFRRGDVMPPGDARQGIGPQLVALNPATPSPSSDRAC